MTPFFIFVFGFAVGSNLDGNFQIGCKYKESPKPEISTSPTSTFPHLLL